MNDKTRNSEFDLIPSIKPAQDEVASYRRSGRADAPKQSNFNGMLVFVIVIMAIMMGVGGFTLYEVQQKLDQSNRLLEKGQENIRELENRLAATGTDVSKTLQIMQGRMETTEFEIRKLWDVANKRNKNWIQDNQTAITNLTKQNANVSARVSSAQASVQEVQDQFTAFASAMDNIRKELQAENTELTTQVSLVRGQLQDQSDKLVASERDQRILKKQIKDAEEAIEAIDQHRAQVNRQILELKNQLKTVGAASPGGN